MPYSLNTHIKAQEIISVNSGLFSFIHTSARQAIVRLSAKVLTTDAPINDADIANMLMQIDGTSSGLKISFGIKNVAYANALATELTAIGFHFVSTNDQGDFSISTPSPATNEAIASVHREIGRYILYVLGTWQIESHNYLRDVYCDQSGSESGINVDENTKKRLRAMFDDVHWMHSAVKVSVLIERSVKSKPTLLKKYDGSNAHHNLNALIHALHLQEQPPQPQTVTPNQAHQLVLKNNGDISQDLVDAKGSTIVLNAGNPFRTLGAALTGAAGSAEELLGRQMNLLRVLIRHLNIDDPIKQLVEGLLLHLKPTGKPIVLGKTKGIPSSLHGVTIPQYLAENEVSRYLDFATKLIRLAKHLPHNLTYNQHMIDEEFVSVEKNVCARARDGRSLQVDVITMIGLDGRKPTATLKLFGFNDEYQTSKEYYDPKTKLFLEEKAAAEYTDRWKKVFEAITNLSKNKNDVTVLLVAVGAGAFDPTPQLHFTYASAHGFAAAYAKYQNALIDGKIHLEFIFRDPPNRECSTRDIFGKAVLSLPGVKHDCIKEAEAAKTAPTVINNDDDDDDNNKDAIAQYQ